MAYGQNYDDAGDSGGPDQRAPSPFDGYDAQHPPPGMMFDPSTNTFISAFNEPQIPGTANGPGITPAPPTTGGAMDDAAILAQIAQWAGMPGADPSLKNDPNYWLGRIKETGGLRADNLQYWQDASVGPKAFFNNPNREGGGNNAGPNIDANPVAADWFSANAPPPASYSQLSRPDYLSQPYTPKQFTEQFNAPTMEDLKNDPGYQAGADLTQKGLERSAAAKGSILSGGFVGSALPRALNDYAGQAYQNLFGRAYDTYQQKYNQFLNAQNADLAARGLNENTFQTDVGNNLNTYKTRYQAYSDAINNNFNLAQLGLNATSAGNPGTPL